MATFTPQDAIDFATEMVKGMPFSRVQVRACDTIAQMLWMAAPWRWTLGSLSPVTLESGQSDYPFDKPSDFLFLETADLWDGTQNSPLLVVGALPDVIPVVGTPTRIAYANTGADILRVSPRPSATEEVYITPIYKKTYTPITALNLGTAGVFGCPDEWSWLIVEGVLWRAYLYADDARANAQGQIFEKGLDEMRQCEKLLYEFPERPKGRG